MTVTTAVVVLPRRVAGWATRRALARNSLSGIALVCSLCAAVWFSAGTPMTALAGGAALGGGCLARRIGRQLSTDAFEGWLAGVCALAGEVAVCAGLAAGARPGRLDPWLLATAAVSLLGLRSTARLVRPWAEPRRPDSVAGPAGTGSSLRVQQVAGVAAGRLLGLPAMERAVVITVSAVGRGTYVALLVLTCWSVVALAWVLAGPRPGGGAGTVPGAVAASRDDGLIARFAGDVTAGQLVPLPPAIAGLTATALLAGVGLHNLPGFLLLTPAVAMLLAAPGSAHPHQGRADWLTPVVLQVGEYLYLVALGYATGVPWPVTFALASLIALRHLDVAYRARQPLPAPAPRGGLGWEGRMLVAGTGAMFGLAMVTYLGLAAYLGVLLGWGSLSSWFVLREGARR